MADPSPTPTYRLGLLGRFRVRRDGTPVRLSLSGQRVVALIGLHESVACRGWTAGVLWPETSDDRAAASLRTTLWRLGRECPGLIDADRTSLRMGPQVAVDARALRIGAHRVLAGDIGIDDGLREAIDAGELLPGWDESWVVSERERLTQLRLHTVARLTVSTTATGALTQGA